jgi:tetratricopeptide (TPR) repeat protein
MRSMAEAREQAELAPEQPYWPLRAGELYLQADSLSQAEEAFREALARNPRYQPALCQLSRLQYAQGRHAEAIDLLVPVVLREDGTPAETSAELAAGLALHLEAHGEFERAEELLAVARRLPVRGENTSTAIIYLALRGNEATAGNAARAAYEADSTRAVNVNNYGIVLLRGGDVARARQAFLRALELHPDLPAALYNLAILERFYQLDDEAGRKWYERYKAIATEDPDGLAEVFGAPASSNPATEGEGEP